MQRIPITRPWTDDAEKHAVAAVLDSGKLWQGENVEAFEEAFAKVIGVDHAVAVASGSAALHLGLRALELPAGSTVHTSPFTYIATAGAVLQAGLSLSLSDVSLASYNLDDDHVEAALDGSNCALLPVHLYGLPAPMDGLLDIARRRKLKVLEDAAQALGARYKGRPVGSLGDAGCFSFNAMKTVTTGEGGMVTTSDAKVADFVRAARDWGQRKRYEFTLLGANMRMTEIDAAIGIVQLGKLTSSNERRAATAAAYNTAFAGISGLVLPLAPPGLDHSWYQYTVRVLGGNTREALIGHLDARGVDTGIYYPQTLPEIALFAGARHPKLVRAQAAAREVLSLPVHPWVGEKERARVVEGVRTFFEPD